MKKFAIVSYILGICTVSAAQERDVRPGELQRAFGEAVAQAECKSNHVRECVVSNPHFEQFRLLDQSQIDSLILACDRDFARATRRYLAGDRNATPRIPCAGFWEYSWNSVAGETRENGWWSCETNGE